MNENKRRRFTAAEKVGILKQHLLEKKPVSDVCDQHQIHPTIFYRWQQEFFQNGQAAFELKPQKANVDLERKVELLEQKLTRKHEVLSELMEEHIALKKSLGES